MPIPIAATIQIFQIRILSYTPGKAVLFIWLITIVLVLYLRSKLHFFF